MISQWLIRLTPPSSMDMLHFEKVYTLVWLELKAQQLIYIVFRLKLFHPFDDLSLRQCLLHGAMGCQVLWPTQEHIQQKDVPRLKLVVESFAKCTLYKGCRTGFLYMFNLLLCCTWMQSVVFNCLNFWLLLANSRFACNICTGVRVCLCFASYSCRLTVLIAYNLRHIVS